MLKWHKEGCYATAFATVEATTKATISDPRSESDDRNELPVSDIARSDFSTLTVQEEREQRARSTHWLAAGSKDGKVSLWNIF